MSAVFIHPDMPTAPITWIPPGRAPVGLEQYISDGPPLVIQHMIRDGYTFVAHNAETFDALAWELLLPDAPQPEWFDTIHLCRQNGLPAGLDRACRALGIQGKDAAGADALKLLYTVKMIRGKPVYPVGTVPLWEIMLRYNVQDVVALRELYLALGTPQEPEVLRVNSTINERGCPVDLRFASALRELWHQHQKKAGEQVDALTEHIISEDDLRSPVKVKKWLATKGLVIDSLERKSIEAMMIDPDGWFGESDNPNVALVTEVIKARQSAVRATVGKIERVFNVADNDNRVRGMFVYHGAHTGRWSGRDLQLHNFPRGVKCNVGKLLQDFLAGNLALAGVETVAQEAKASVGDVLATLMRPVIRAPEGKAFVIYDYAAVEARGIAWIAGEEEVLGVFANPKMDVYKRMASILFSIPQESVDDGQRFIAKQIVLGCGYGMGANKFDAMCRLYKVDLAKAGVTADQCVKAYREGHPNIKRCWRNLDVAAKHAVVTGREMYCHRTHFRHTGSDLQIQLPSGRVLTYRNAGIRPLPPKWDPSARPVDTLTYANPHGIETILYGGLIAENIVQALCRDLLADALVRLDVANMQLVSHVHDEILVECPEASAEWFLGYVGCQMSKTPTWAKGFPLRVEGFVSEWYVKGGLRGCLKGDYMNGRRAE